jgi:hypothetical protein
MFFHLIDRWISGIIAIEVWRLRQALPEPWQLVLAGALCLPGRKSAFHLRLTIQLFFASSGFLGSACAGLVASVFLTLADFSPSNF